jgi:hypothetical protein
MLYPNEDEGPQRRAFAAHCLAEPIRRFEAAGGALPYDDLMRIVKDGGARLDDLDQRWWGGTVMGELFKVFFALAIHNPERSYFSGRLRPRGQCRHTNGCSTNSEGAADIGARSAAGESDRMGTEHVRLTASKSAATFDVLLPAQVQTSCRRPTRARYSRLPPALPDAHLAHFAEGDILVLSADVCGAIATQDREAIR